MTNRLQDMEERILGVEYKVEKWIAKSKINVLKQSKQVICRTVKTNNSENNKGIRPRNTDNRPRK